MSRDEDLVFQTIAALEERTHRGKGWISLPSVSPIEDLPNILLAVQKA